MNFFGHAVVACRQAPSSLLALGAMLPDFASMSGNRIERVRDDELQAGIELHHATDEVFHRVPCFVSLCAESMAHLSGSGLHRGSARAVSHIGVELVLDGELSRDERACLLYDQALEDAGRESVIDAIEWRDPPSPERWRLQIKRLREGGIPAAYADAEFVTRRIYYLLAPRKRLALEERQLGVVDSWVRSVRPRVAERTEEIMSLVQGELPIPG